MDLHALMRQFAQRQGLVLSEPPDGVYRLSAEDRLEIRLFASGRVLLIEGAAGRLSAPRGPARARRLLELLQEGRADLLDRDEVLTIDIAGDQAEDAASDALLRLFRRLPLDGLTADTLETALERFLNQLERWQRRLLEAPAPMAAPYVLFP